MEPPLLELDPEALRVSMRRWATGVTVVTSVFQGVRHGMTVSSFTSISLAPPLVLVTLQQNTRTHDIVRQAGIFGVTILNENQMDISERFAGRVLELQDRFENLDTFTLVTGASFPTGGLVHLDCRVVTMHEAGSNTLFIGEVVGAQIGSPGKPLLYHNRGYHRLCD